MEWAHIWSTQWHDETTSASASRCATCGFWKVFQQTLREDARAQIRQERESPSCVCLLLQTQERRFFDLKARESGSHGDVPHACVRPAISP